MIDMLGKEILARIFRERDWYKIEDFTIFEERRFRGLRKKNRVKMDSY
jgi:hypothetical protein